MCIDSVLTNLSKLSNTDLLALHSSVNDVLRSRNLVRTSNNPTGDIAEYLFCRAFGWKIERNSNAHYDAADEDGKLYQIKARRITRYNKSRQMSAIRGLYERKFDYLACVLFRENYTVLKAAIIPLETVVEESTEVKRTNSCKFVLRDKIWNVAGVRDVTQELNFVQL